jgi:hypothetical protein
MWVFGVKELEAFEQSVYRKGMIKGAEEDSYVNAYRATKGRRYLALSRYHTFQGAC